MSTFTQEHRRIAIETPLGKDTLLLKSFVGVEEISRLFTYRLEMLSTKDSIAAKDIVGKNVTFWVEFNDGSPRHFNGFVKSFSYTGKGDRLSMYRCEVVPWLWFLTRTADCRIFQNKTVPDIIKQIFSDLGFSDFQMEAKGNHPTREFCVQYRESDFRFVSRLMEEEGMFYYFKHEQGKHTLVIGDNKSSFKDLRDKEVQMAASEAIHELPDQIYTWEHSHEFRTGKWAQTDFNFETPSTSLMTKTNSVVQLDGVSKYEVYDYPGFYQKKPDGDAETKLRMEEEETGFDLVHGTSHCRSFGPGGKFKMAKHHNPSEAGKGYVVTSVRHTADMGGSYVSGGGATEGYRNEFTCIPDTVNFRPARITPQPRIHGSQTAIVVGPKGEEIYTDKYGRVMVQFHWDREGKKDEKSSCWIRVSSPWTGKNWGMIHIPRIGQEVVVSFLEGNPDRPLITGMVYNAETMPPWTLPDNKTQSGIKTRSTKQAGDPNFNELRFEDKKGNEDIYFHAEKTFHRVVETDDDLQVGNDQTKTIQNNRTLLIKKGDDATKLEKGSRSVLLEMGDDSLNLKMGNQATKLDLGKSETEAMQSIELKVGQSSIKLDQTGVTIKGMMINVEGQIMTNVKGLMTNISADALLAVKGGITMIG